MNSNSLRGLSFCVVKRRWRVRAMLLIGPKKVTFSQWLDPETQCHEEAQRTRDSLIRAFQKLGIKVQGWVDQNGADQEPACENGCWLMAAGTLGARSEGVLMAAVSAEPPEPRTET